VSLYESLTTHGGTNINYHRVLAVGSGLLAGAFFGSMAGFVSGLMHAMFIDPVTGLTTWSHDLVSLFFRLLTVGSNKIWTPSYGLVRHADVLAFAVALAFAITLGVIVAYTQRWIDG